ncbi:tumor necrosis factor ligand superfamily member 8 [Pseudophryne corroboree]|uniref:tumor necrosis factor ligand superfamily member 8 n=1 Tax=Pseudophryne corroboree TaxID=495146 RepID=UPI003081D8A4
MEPQDLADRELRAIKKRLCFISSTACVLCIVCTAATLVLVFTHRTGSPLAESVKEHITQRQDAQSPLCTASRKVHAQLKWCTKEKHSSSTLLWKKNSPLHGIKYQDGNLTILTKGLYFVNCHLHFAIKDCLKKEEDLRTSLIVNGRPVHEMLYTLWKNSTSCSKIFRDQHFSLQIELNVFDNVSIQTNHADWLNGGLLADSIVFGAFLL